MPGHALHATLQGANAACPLTTVGTSAFGALRHQHLQVVGEPVGIRQALFFGHQCVVLQNNIGERVEVLRLGAFLHTVKNVAHERNQKVQQNNVHEQHEDDKEQARERGTERARELLHVKVAKHERKAREQRLANVTVAEDFVGNLVRPHLGKIDFSCASLIQREEREREPNERRTQDEEEGPDAPTDHEHHANQRTALAETEHVV